MMYLISIIVLIIIFVGLILDRWVTTHALSILINEKWQIQSIGWSGLWPPVSGGLLAGLAIGLFLGISLASELGKYLRERKTLSLADAQAELEKQQIALAKDRAAADAHIKKATNERVANLRKANDDLIAENDKLKRDLIAQKNKTDIIEGKLKGAQQKNARLKKHV